MNVRQIDLDTEYDALCSWWTARGLVAPAKVILQSATGFAVQNNGQDIVAGWLYVANTGVLGWVGWVVSNPEVVDQYSTGIAVSMLYDFLEKFGFDSGCSVLFSTAEAHGSIRRFLDRHDWIFCEGPPHIHMLKVIRTKAQIQ